MGGGCGTGGNEGVTEDFAELTYRTTDALCLQFRTQIVKGYCIPPHYKIIELTGIALHGLNGDNVNPESVNSLSREHFGKAVRQGLLDLVPKRIANGFELCFFGSRYESPAIQGHLGCRDTFYKGWSAGIGDVYQFIDREEASQKSKDFFNPEEREMFEAIGELMVPYLERIHAPCKCN